MIYDVENDDDSTIIQDIYEQNLKDTTVTPEIFKCVQKYKKKEFFARSTGWWNVLQQSETFFGGQTDCSLDGSLVE